MDLTQQAQTGSPEHLGLRGSTEEGAGGGVGESLPVSP